MSLITIPNISENKNHQFGDLNDISAKDCMALNKKIRKMRTQFKIEKIKMYVFKNRQKICLASLFKTFPYLVDFELRRRVMDNFIDNGRMIFGFKKLMDYSTLREITIEYRYINEALKFSFHSISKIKVYLNDHLFKNSTVISCSKMISFLEKASKDTTVEIILNFGSSEELFPKFPLLDYTLNRNEYETNFKFQNLEIAVEVDHQRVIYWKFQFKDDARPSTADHNRYQWKGIRTQFNNYIKNRSYKMLIPLPSSISAPLIQSSLRYLTKTLCNIKCWDRELKNSSCPLHYTYIDKIVVDSWNIENFREKLRKRVSAKDGHLILTYDNASIFNALFSKNIDFVSSDSSSSSSFQFENVFELILKYSTRFPSQNDKINNNSSSIIAKTFPNLKRLELVRRQFLFPNTNVVKNVDYSFEKLLEIKIDSLTDRYGLSDHTRNLKILKLSFGPKKIDVSGLFEFLRFNQSLERIELNIKHRYQGVCSLVLKGNREIENKNVNFKEIIINVIDFKGNTIFKWHLKASNGETEKTGIKVFHFSQESLFFEYLENSHDRVSKTFIINSIENFGNSSFLNYLFKSLHRYLNKQKMITRKRKRERNWHLASKNKCAKISD